MKTNASIPAGLLAAALGFGVGSAHASLLSDGDFESFSSLVADQGYTKISGGSMLGGWTVGGTSVDLVRNNYGAIDDISVDLSGTPGPGSLSQTFNAVQGTTYILSFDYFRNGTGADMTVSFGGQSHSYTPGASPITQTLSWTAASSGLQTVMFSGPGVYQGPTLDNVVLTAAPVPEPSTLALLLAGTGAIGFIARRRKLA